jgi:hypothetical protein
MTVNELYDLISELSCNEGEKELKIVVDEHAGGFLCTDEGNGKVKIIANI